MKRILLFAAILLLAIYVCAQESGSKDFISFELRPYLSSKLKFYNVMFEDEHILKSRNAPCGELSIGYQREINSNWLVGLDIASGLMPLNYCYVSKNGNSRIVDSEYLYWVTLYTNIMASSTNRIFTSPKGNILLGLKAGAVLPWVREWSSSVTSSSYYTHAEVENDAAYFICSGELAYEKVFESNDKLKAGVFVTYSPMMNSYGYFVMNNPSNSGLFKQPMLYFGISAAYYLALSRNK
jgi:hypothetical protein